MSNIENLQRIAYNLRIIAEKLKDSSFFYSIDKLRQVSIEYSKAWSGSYLGYHTNVYYKNFNTPPPGARFSQECGIIERLAIEGTVGDWIEYRFADVIKSIYDKSGISDITTYLEASEKVSESFEDAKSQILSILSIIISENSSDKFIADLFLQAENIKIMNNLDMEKAMMPKGNFITRDMLAAEKGASIPAHLSVLSKIGAIKSPYINCDKLSKIALRAASHMQNLLKQKSYANRIGTNVFIGHGSSNSWKDLKDFIQDRLHLPWDEFNRVPIAGITNIARLSQMLEESAIAFLIMTAEDEQIDGKLHARMNVIHEAGLFQGRLGFHRAIIVLEEGCEEFSNIEGLGQIRFPKGNISAAFENIRRVMEREDLL